MQFKIIMGLLIFATLGMLLYGAYRDGKKVGVDTQKAVEQVKKDEAVKQAIDLRTGYNEDRANRPDRAGVVDLLRNGEF